MNKKSSITIIDILMTIRTKYKQSYFHYFEILQISDTQNIS